MMKTPLKLSRTAARHVMLASLGLLEPPSRPATKPDLLGTIRKMGVLQLDTIHVVARSQYFVLWSRLGDYSPAWLDELLAEGDLFEHWSHAACLIPQEDFPLYRRFMLTGVHGWSGAPSWIRENPAVVDRVMERIRQEGGLRSADFENETRPPGGWWAWKDEKTALECLLIQGRILVSRREKFQRIYDLFEHIKPEWDDRQTPGLEETYLKLTSKTVLCLGIARPQWIPDYFRLPKRGTEARLDILSESGELFPAVIEGWESPAYIHREHMALAEAASRGDLNPQLTTFLTPFDPLVWDRARARDLFDFDYTIECYLPSAKRRYGYFNLPILHHDRLVGRLDAKANRREGIFEIRSLHMEPGVSFESSLSGPLAATLQRCAVWHATPSVVLNQTTPPGWKAFLEDALYANQ